MLLARHREQNYGAQEIKSSVEVNPPDVFSFQPTPNFAVATDKVTVEVTEENEETKEEKRKPGRPSKKE